jgi:hypothetical protein
MPVRARPPSPCPRPYAPTLGSAATASGFDGAKAGQARLRQLSDAADPRTRTYEARYVLSGPGRQAPLGSTLVVALPGSAATARSAAGGADRAPSTTPARGRASGSSSRSTSTVNGARAPRRLGAETATISDGLAGGERFVALGAHMLHQGQRVRLQAGAAQ